MMIAAITLEAAGDAAQAIAVILAGLIVIGSIAGMAIIAGRAWAASKYDDEPENLGADAEFHPDLNKLPFE